MALQLIAATSVEIATGVVDTGTLFDGAFVGLFKGVNEDLGPDSTLADLIEADYPGYARQAVGTWVGPFSSADGRLFMHGDMLDFSPTGASEDNVIIGWFLATLVAAGVLIAYEFLDDPVPLPGAGSVLSVQPRVGPLLTWPWGNGVEV